MGYPRWSEIEVAFLREHNSHMMHKEMAVHLPGRNASGVRRKCMELGLVRGYWHLPPHERLPEVPLLDAVYLAGHFDGEGCVSMRHRGTKYNIVSSVTAAWVPVLERYKRLFGGSIVPSRPRRGTKKALWRWALTGYAAVLFFLETISPYLSEKREQAEVALTFIRIRIQASHAYPGHDIRQLAAECSTTLRRLKRAA